jgi:futalosine hydrolase
MRLLAVTAVPAERDAVLRHLGTPRERAIGRYAAATVETGAGDLDVVAGGIGAAAAAAATATALALDSYDAVLSLGVGGGFDGRCAVGDIAVAHSVLAADLGVETPDGFRTFGDLGLIDTGIATGCDWEKLAARVGGVAGLILTVNTVTGTDERAAWLAGRWDPVAEAMEGWGVWSVLADPVTPYEVRAISNRCGRRDRDAWDIDGALDALARACADLFAEELP